MINIKVYYKKLKIITQKIIKNLKIRLILYKKIKYLDINNEMLISEHNKLFEIMKTKKTEKKVKRKYSNMTTKKFQLVSKYANYPTWDEKQNAP